MHSQKENTGEIVALWMETARLMKQKFLHAHKGSFNPLQIFALFVITEHDGLTMKELAQHLRITSPSATSMVNRLVRLGWVKRTADESNRKLVRVIVAPKGKKVFGSMMKHQAQSMGEILSILQPSEQKDFARILSHLHKGLLSQLKR